MAWGSKTNNSKQVSISHAITCPGKLPSSARWSGSGVVQLIASHFCSLINPISGIRSRVLGASTAGLEEYENVLV